MTDKQRRFVDEYMIDLNATQAAIRAGYSPKNADKIGPELLGKTRVSTEITKLKAERSRTTTWTAERVVSELAKIALDPEAKRSDKIKALELIGKHGGMFQDKVEVSGGIRIDPESVKALAEEVVRTQDDVNAVADRLGVRHD